MKFKLNISKPCHENWHNMLSTQKGRFCASCQKEVIDFTKLSSTEIARKTRKAKQLCGRFTSTQLKREYVSSSQNPLSSLGIALGLGSLIAVAQPALAQENQPSKVKVYPKNDVQVAESNQPTVQKDSITITGTVFDPDNIPLPGVTVIQQNTVNGTQTDFDGNFSIQIAQEDLNNEVFLAFSYVGFDTKVIPMNLENQTQAITLKMDNPMILGGVMVCKPNIFQRFLNLFRRKENRR